MGGKEFTGRTTGICCTATKLTWPEGDGISRYMELEGRAWNTNGRQLKTRPQPYRRYEESFPVRVHHIHFPWRSRIREWICVPLQSRYSFRSRESASSFLVLSAAPICIHILLHCLVTLSCRISCADFPALIIAFSTTMLLLPCRRNDVSIRNLNRHIDAVYLLRVLVIGLH